MDTSTMMNALTTQLRQCYVYLLMSVFVIMNISNPRHRMYNDAYSMNVFNIVNVLISQLGTSCVFDSPGLARDEPTLGYQRRNTYGVETCIS